MGLKNEILNFFQYKPQNNEIFLIPKSPNNITEEKDEQCVFSNYDENLKYIKTKYNLLINSDIDLHEFEIKISNKKFKACLLMIDGMVDNDSISNFILSPLLLKNAISNSPKKQTSNHPEISKFDLKDFLMKNLITRICK